MKFEGEGVDDYGGPYREVFTQVAAELMSTVPSPPQPEIARGTSSAVASCDQRTRDVHLLPVLEPRPGPPSEGGDVGQEFMVKGNVRQERYLRFYKFYGNRE